MYNYQINGEAVKVIQLETGEYIAEVMTIEGLVRTNPSRTKACTCKKLRRKLERKNLPNVLKKTYKSSITKTLFSNNIREKYMEFVVEFVRSQDSDLSYREVLAISFDAIEKASNRFRVSTMVSLEDFLKSYATLEILSHKVRKEGEFVLTNKYNNQLTESQKEKLWLMLLEVSPQVRNIYRVYMAVDMKKSDFMDEFTVGFAKSLSKYDLSVGGDVVEYFLKGVKFRVLENLRNNGALMSDINVSKVSASRESLLTDIYESSDNVSGKVEAKQYLNEMFEYLIENKWVKAEDIEIFCRYYGLVGYADETQAEIAKSTKQSQANVAKKLAKVNREANLYVAIFNDGH